MGRGGVGMREEDSCALLYAFCGDVDVGEVGGEVDIEFLAVPVDDFRAAAEGAHVDGFVLCVRGWGGSFVEFELCEFVAETAANSTEGVVFFEDEDVSGEAGGFDECFVGGIEFTGDVDEQVWALHREDANRREACGPDVEATSRVTDPLAT